MVRKKRVGWRETSEVLERRSYEDVEEADT